MLIIYNKNLRYPESKNRAIQVGNSKLKKISQAEYDIWILIQIYGLEYKFELKLFLQKNPINIQYFCINANRLS